MFFISIFKESCKAPQYCFWWVYIYKELVEHHKTKVFSHGKGLISYSELLAPANGYLLEDSAKFVCQLQVWNALDENAAQPERALLMHQ